MKVGITTIIMMTVKMFCGLIKSRSGSLLTNMRLKKFKGKTLKNILGS
jgi:hypothetical protein